MCEVAPNNRALKKYTALLALFAVLTSGWILGSRPADAATAPVSGDAVGFATGAQFLWESATDQQRDLDNMVATGAKWLRLDFPWPSIQPSATTWNWSTFDRVVTLVRSRGMSIVGLPAYTPTWAKAAGSTGAGYPADPSAFANFVSVLVNRYEPQGLTTWEIWNEPNQAWSWNPPSPTAYTALLQRAWTAVKAADPSATVITAGLAPATDAADGSQVAPITFLRGIYSSGGKGYFDAVAMHPYCYPAMPTDTSTSSWSAWFNMPTMHQTMVDNGDGAKKIWMTEMGAPTGTGAGAVTESNQSTYVDATFAARVQWASWLGPLFWYSARDSGTNLADREQNFGLWRFDFSAKQSAATFASHITNTAATTTTSSTTSTTSTSTTSTTSTTTSTTSTTIPSLTSKKRPRR